MQTEETQESLEEFESHEIAADFEDYYLREKEMREALSRTKSFWKGLINQVKAVYDPQLVPVRENGIIIGWVDARTGMQPWFS